MATFSRVSPTGWSQGDDASNIARVSPTGWDQVNAAAAAFKAYWARGSNQLIGRMMKKNVASQIIGAQMVSATDGSAFTGTVSALVTKDGGTQTAGGGTVTHEGNGYHTYSITQSETNADLVAVTFTGTGAVPATIQVYTSFPQTGDAFDRLGAPAGASVSADVAAIKTQTGAIETDTQDIQARLPAALVSGRMDASVGAMAANTLTASALATDAVSEIQSGLSTLDAAGVRSAIGLASANLDTQLDALPTAAEIADAVWDEALSGHTTAGSAGKALSDAGSAGDPWSTAVPGAYSAGQAGKILGDYLNASVSSRATQTSVDTLAGYVDTEVAAIKAKTDNLPASPAATGDIPSAATVATAVRSELNTELGRIDATVSSRATQTSVDTIDDLLDTEVAAIKAKTDLIPASPAAVSDIPTALTIADAVWDEATSGHTTAGTYGGRLIRSTGSNVEVMVTGSNHVAADVHEFQADVLTSAAIAADAITAAALASDVATEIAAAVWDTTIASHVNAGSTGLALRDADLRGSRTVIRGTVGTGTTPSTTQLTPSSISPAGAAADQFKGRILIFDNDTSTAALRGQATDITANSNASTPLLTFTALTTAPASGDTFSIV